MVQTVEGPKGLSGKNFPSEVFFFKENNATSQTKTKKSQNFSKIVLVLLSASVKRFSVSRMQDFLLAAALRCAYSYSLKFITFQYFFYLIFFLTIFMNNVCILSVLSFLYISLNYSILGPHVFVGTENIAYV